MSAARARSQLDQDSSLCSGEFGELFTPEFGRDVSLFRTAWRVGECRRQPTNRQQWAKVISNKGLAVADADMVLNVGGLARYGAETKNLSGDLSGDLSGHQGR